MINLYKNEWQPMFTRSRSGLSLDRTETYCFLLSGVRPVLVTFQEFKDKEDVLRKSGMLKGTNIHLTEDMSR